jgi:hypothetical protein
VKTWELVESIALIRELEPLAQSYGYHCALTGGVLFRGYSEKDLDIFFYVSKTKRGANRPGLFQALTNFGFRKWEERTPYHKDDDKPVFAVEYEGRRIDLIFPVVN